MDRDERKWNYRLIEYAKKIQNQTLDLEELDDMLYDLIGLNNEKNYKDIDGNKENLIKTIKSSKYAIDMLVERFGYDINKVYVGDLKADDIHGKVFPYEIVFGNVDFGNRFITDDGIHFTQTRQSSAKDIVDLKIVMGEANFQNSLDFNIKNLKFVLGDLKIDGQHDDFNVQLIGGNVDFNHFFTKDASSIIYIGGDLDASNSGIENMSSLQEVRGSIKGLPKKLSGLPNLEKVGGDLCLDGTNFKNLPKLEVVKGNINTGNCNGMLKVYLKMKFKNTESGYIKRIISGR